MWDEPINGAVINNSYEVRTPLARGGMATVYRAHQISMKRDVAIKILPREFLHEPTFLERFRQEAAIAAHLEHRAIVPVYDYGEWEGTPYIVMRFMEGGSVDGLIEGGFLDLERAQQIIRQVASALDYAHKRDVLHRDLKPSNILLDSNGDAYITDFGIARILNRAEKLTSTGVVGTPAYMSPEQAQGFELDGRSDVYALGIVLYEMLTGRRPFDGDTPYSVAVMQVTKQPPPPRSFNPNIPPGVEMVILKALEKERERRFNTASELAGALDDADLMILSQTTPRPITAPVYAPAHPTPQPSMVAVRREQRGVSPLMYLGMAALLGVVVAVVLIITYGLAYNPPPTSPDFAATGVFRLTATAANGGAALPGAEKGGVLFSAERAGQVDLYLYDFATQRETRLTETRGAERQPALSADGQWVAYAFDPDGKRDEGDESQTEIYIQRLNGGETRQLTSNLLPEYAPAWMPDNTALIYLQTSANGREFRLMRYDLAARQESALFQAVGTATSPAVAPNGARIVFVMGTDLVLFDVNSGLLNILSVSSGSPQWNPAGDRILYLGSDGSTIMEMLADGSQQQVIYVGEGDITRPTYNLSGTRILFGMDGKLYTIAPDGSDLNPLFDALEAVWVGEG